MTDREIIQGLIDRDNSITDQFFYVKCRPLLTAIMRLVFSYPVEYNEMVSELYGYLMEEDGLKLRHFQYRSTIYQWMKVVATRFFIRERDSFESWTYSPVRNDALRQHPDLVPYSQLPDNEKEYDRLMAMNTLRLVRRLGFDIINRIKD